MRQSIERKKHKDECSYLLSDLSYDVYGTCMQTNIGQHDHNNNNSLLFFFVTISSLCSFFSI